MVRMSTHTPVPPLSGGLRQQLLHGLLDDASLFPPASLSMAAAIAAHARHATAWYSDLTGPFVCAETRLAELGTVLTATGTTGIELSLVVTAGAPAVGAALDAVLADPRIRLRAIEVPAARGEDLARAITQVATALDNSPLAATAGYIEYPLGAIADQATAGQLLAITDHRGYRPKLRTGGVTAEAFPDEHILAAALAQLAERRIPFKCTAGLHHAVRHTGTGTGFEHHGFLNVLLAVGAALSDAPVTEIAAALAQRDPATVAAQVGALDPEAAAEIRSLFTSFGTCSTDEPVADLVGLGLLSKPLA
jgi:hypothetical protein